MNDQRGEGDNGHILPFNFLKTRSVCLPYLSNALLHVVFSLKITMVGAPNPVDSQLKAVSVPPDDPIDFSRTDWMDLPTFITTLPEITKESNIRDMAEKSIVILRHPPPGTDTSPSAAMLPTDSLLIQSCLRF